MQIIITPLFSSVVSFLVGGALSWLVRSIEGKKKHESAVGKGIMFLLRRDLISRCDKLIEAEDVDLQELDSIRAEHAIYKSLGGNGDVAARLEIIEERIIRN